MIKHFDKLAAVAVALGLVSAAVAAPAEPKFFAPPLPGATATDSWANFDNWTGNPNYGGIFPGNGAWVGPMTAVTSSQAATQEAEFVKVSGRGYPTTFGGPDDHKFIYLPSTAAPGTTVFRVFDTDPIANLQTVVFQIATGPGTAGGVDFTTTPVVLNYNSGAGSISATPTSGEVRYSEIGPDFLDPDASGVAYRERYWQFDLSSVVGTINNFEVVWSQPSNHSQIYSIQLDQGNTFVPVPEPTMLGLVGVGALAMLRRRSVR